MRRTATNLARAIGYIEATDLNRDGKVSFPEMVKAIATQFGFQKFPQNLGEMDIASNDGVAFFEGKSGDIPIQKFAIWTHIIVVETRSDTDDSKQVMEEILLWGVARFGLSYKPGMIKRFAYVSSITFNSDIPVLDASLPLANLAAETSKAVSEVWQEPIHFEPTFLAVGHDPTTRKFSMAQFQITRRADVKYSENKYFSEAPLPTKTHVALLEQFENDVAMMRKAGNT